MARYALAIDCNRCVGCMACNGACKMTNNVPIGSFWNKVLRSEEHTSELQSQR